MRILYGITKSNMGGAQRYVLDLAMAAKAAGHEVAVLLGGKGPLLEKLEKEKIRVITLPSLERDVKIWKDFKSFFEMIQILRDEKPDVFHINSTKMGAMGTLAGRLVGTRKIIFTAHGWAFNEARHWAQKLLIEELAWLTIVFSHKTICVSERLKYDIDSKPFVENKLVVIHNGLDKFNLLPRATARQKLLPDMVPDTFLVGSLAELHHTKGFDIALRAVNKTPSRVHFAILGTGQSQKELRELATTLGIKDRVHFLGYIEDARQYLKAFDILTLTSRTEGLPYMILEAGLASLPVVATNVGGIPEVIKDKENGFLFPTEDHKMLATLLNKLIESPEERKKLGDGLHKTVTSHFSKEEMLRETFSLYR